MSDITNPIFTVAKGQTTSVPGHHVRSTTACIPFSKEEIERSVPECFARVVSKYPDRLALKIGKQKLTYEMLDNASDWVAHTILARLGPGAEPVALLFEHGISPIVAILGVLKTGKSYVMLNPSHARTKLHNILEDVQTHLIVTDHQNATLAAELTQNAPCQFVTIDELDACCSEQKMNVSVSPNSLAAIFYTSGSTGQPKGITCSHREILHAVWYATNVDHICPEDRQSLLFSCAFAASMPDIFYTLLNGATLYPYNIQQAGLNQLADWLIQEEITIFHPPVTLFRQLFDMLTGTEKFPKLRLIILAGQTVYKNDIARFKKYFSVNCVLIHQLASTEASIISQFVIDHQTEITSNVVPVGYAMWGKDLLLIDETSQEVGFNCVGEIAIRSRYFSPGYWNDPELTRQKFLPDPEGSDQRIYLTGDLGRMRPDGCLEYLGRKDFMVKIRGYRVGLAEVEAGLYNTGLVKEAVVVAKEVPNGDTRLIAYLVPATQAAPTISELRRRVADTLPDYMLPSVFVMMDKLPLTPTGKVDRQALPEPTWTRPDLEVALVSPRDPIELQLTRIWEQVLKMSSIGIHDNFFELGGDSMLALHLVAQIENTLGKALPLPTLLQAPTIAQLAEVLRQEGWMPLWSSLVAIQPSGSNPPFFCVPPAAVTALHFVKFARYFGPDQPFYGLQPRGLDQDEVTPHTRVEEMATYYLNEIRQFQPEGPYYLGGQCFGGIVAFEMAQQLVAQGQPVALLAILDTKFPPGVIASKSSPGALVRHYWQRGKQAWQEGEFWQLGGRKLKHWLRKYSKRKRLARLWQRVMRPIAGAITRLQVWDAMEMPQRLRIQRVKQAHHAARRAYGPRVYPGKITFFWSRDTQRGQRKQWARWSTEALEIHVCPGRHRTMFHEPHIRVVAEQLRVCIEQAHAAASN